ncbi:MAG: C1 family peptidase, partial [Verrucomicrobiota bacterium]
MLQCLQLEAINYPKSVTFCNISVIFIEMKQLFARLALVLSSPLLCDSVVGQNSTGLTFLDKSKYLSLPEASPSYRGVNVPVHDLSGNFPLPGNQGQQGSCVGWAVSYGLKSFQEQVERKWTIDSADKVFSPSFVFNMIKFPGAEAGANFEVALNFLQEVGTVPLSEFPYSDQDFTTKPTNDLIVRGAKYRIQSWSRVSPEFIGEIKGHLLNNYPVLVGCRVGWEFSDHLSGANKSKPFVQKFHDPDLSGHAMVVVGFNDNRNAFKLLNSWGREKGDNGYVWVNYQTFSRITREA